MTRYRITARGEAGELRGYIDGDEYVKALADSMLDEVYMIVIASPAPDDYDPFTETYDQAFASLGGTELPGDAAFEAYANGAEALIFSESMNPKFKSKHAFAAGWDARRRYDEEES